MMTSLTYRFFIMAVYAFVLANVSLPSSMAVIFLEAMPCVRSQYFPDAASVVRSPGAPAPTVIIVGA